MEEGTTLAKVSPPPPLTSAPWPTLLDEVLPRHFTGSCTFKQAVWAARRPALCIPFYQLTLEEKQEGGEFSELASKLGRILQDRASLLNLTTGLCGGG